ETCVTAGLKGVQANKLMVVPGLLYSLVVPLMPHGLARQMSAYMMRQSTEFVSRGSDRLGQTGKVEHQARAARKGGGGPRIPAGLPADDAGGYCRGIRRAARQRLLLLQDQGRYRRGHSRPSASRVRGDACPS